jgi:RNA polymerase sigma-70 factor (ECF subfamily)
MTESFQALRPLLFAIAYRMLGSAAEAEDVLQDAWLRFQAASPVDLESEKAWLSTVVTRLCLDRLKSARRMREEYVGPWLPEPIRTEERTDPDSISLAFLILLERLSPLERAAYLLHEVFDYSHAEIAGVLGKEEAAVRQLFHRAAAHVRDGKPRYSPTRADHERLLTGFVQALTTGDLAALQGLLADDATLTADSGGKVRAAARQTVHGARAVAQFLAGLVRKFPAGPEQTFEIVDVNGWPAFVARTSGVASAVMSIETDGTHILAIRNVVNPEKLARV